MSALVRSMSREEQLALPAVWCDFNSRGWSGAPDDDCYYVLNKSHLQKLEPKEGLKFFAFMEDSESEFTGVAVILGPDRGSWRARAITDSFVYGKLPELNLHT